MGTNLCDNSSVIDFNPHEGLEQPGCDARPSASPRGAAGSARAPGSPCAALPGCGEVRWMLHRLLKRSSRCLWEGDAEVTADLQQQGEGAEMLHSSRLKMGRLQNQKAETCPTYPAYHMHGWSKNLCAVAFVTRLRRSGDTGRLSALGARCHRREP